MNLDSSDSNNGTSPPQPQPQQAPSAPQVPRRRQQRLHLSCSECRRRKIRCDRAKPCHPCVKADRGDRCHYDTPPAAPGRTVPGQLVFAARPAHHQMIHHHHQATATVTAKSKPLPPQPPPPPQRGSVQQQHSQPTPPSAAAAAVDLQQHQQQQQPPPQHPRPPPPPGSSLLSSSSRLGSLSSAELQPRGSSGGAGGYDTTNSVQFQPPAPAVDAIPPLRLFWHGSKAGDQYVSPFDRRTITVPKEVVFGDNDATVYWGRSHEANFVPRITDMTTSLLRSVEEGEVSTLFEVERHTRPAVRAPAGMDPDLLGLLPPRATADRLWRTYIDNFESYYRILHVPTFEREYRDFWATRQGPRCFPAQLLSICALASCFRDEDRLYQEAQVRAWIEAVRQWLFRADPRAQLSLGYLQAHLLMLVAGDVHWMKIDRSWISSGALIRNAVSAGLHREPRDFPRVSPFYAELRRRLWYSILEYDLVTALAKGRPPTVRDDEYDCELPASTFDEFISDTSSEGAIRQHVGPGVYSIGGPVQPQINIVLARYLPLRSRVCRAVNGIRLDVDYDEILHLDAEVQEFLREASQVGSEAAGSFKRSLSTILSQRCVIALHAPFVTRALHDPKWIYSRARCLETARAILSEALSVLDRQQAATIATATTSSSSCATPAGVASVAGDAGPFATITNICRCEISNSVFLICHELLAQAVEQRGLAEHASPLSLTTAASSSFRANGGGGRWGQEQRGGGGGGDKEGLVRLVERTSAALDRVCKADPISQRTCAWVRLSAELCRAAAPNDEATIPAVREAIRRGIQVWREQRETTTQVLAEFGQVGQQHEMNMRHPANPMMAPVFEGGALDEDYFNLFFDINTLGGFE